jgi:YVTN family beta-propeller protein
MNHGRVSDSSEFECGRAGCGPKGWEVPAAEGKNAGHVLLISTYELGHQPFGLAEPAAMLRERGAVVRTVDLAVERLDDDVCRGARLIAFYVPMHTATRLAARMIPKVRSWNPTAHTAAYGLYAPMNEIYLRRLGVQTVLGGEFEEGLAALAQRIERGVEAAPGEQLEPRVSVARQDFVIPDRKGLPSLDRYAYLRLPNGDRRIAGYVEASRGCKHLCRHCPVGPVYNGRFRIIPREIVLGDVRQQAAAGARHITFGDPDFFNGGQVNSHQVKGAKARALLATVWVAVLVGRAPAGASEAFITAQSGDEDSALDLGSQHVVARIPVLGWPAGIPMARDGRTAYVTNTEGKYVSVTDTTSRKIVAKIAIPDTPLGIAADAACHFIYVAGLMSPRVARARKRRPGSQSA